MHDSWREFLKGEFEKPYFKELSEFLSSAYDSRTVFPEKSRVFSAFTFPLDGVRVVILGQDPYHGAGQAHGLAFSVQRSVPTPPSLQNIFKEIRTDIGGDIPSHGNLGHWASQGVFLLNNVLTVEEGRAGSHRGKGWETFTEEVVKHLSAERTNLVFLLWGRDARNKKPLIDSKKHLVLEAPHPSPLSAHYGFFGCKHFSKTNDYLRSQWLKEIDW